LVTDSLTATQNHAKQIVSFVHSKAIETKGKAQGIAKRAYERAYLLVKK
jgi:hypothetical protein